VTSSIKTIFDDAAQAFDADFLLVDVGPNLGALNRATLIATDSVVVPVASDLFSLQGIKNLGKTLFQWRKDWHKRLEEYRKDDKSLIPAGVMQPIGYVVMQYTAKDKRPVKSYLNFANQIPLYYRKYVTDEAAQELTNKVEADPYCLGLLKHYHSLAPMAMEANKPIFFLKPSDGAIGAHVQAVRRSYADFEAVANQIIALATIKTA
jgi:cellulose biosynthesis protein BcsQ